MDINELNRIEDELFESLDNKPTLFKFKVKHGIKDIKLIKKEIVLKSNNTVKSVPKINTSEVVLKNKSTKELLNTKNLNTLF